MPRTPSNLLVSEILALQRRTPSFINKWLLRGFLDYYIREHPNSFFPHNFVGSSSSPIDVLADLYFFGDTQLKKKLRSALLICSSLLVSDDAVDTPLSSIQRLRLARVFARLAPAFHCHEVAIRFTRAALGEAVGLETSAQSADMFALAVGCLTELSITAPNASTWSEKVSVRLEDQLVRLINSERFVSAYAPRCLYALVLLNPESFFTRYRYSLGRHIRQHNFDDAADSEYAYLTASVIIEHCFTQLQKYADTLEVHSGENKDGWIFDALDHPKSQYYCLRIGSDPSVVYFKRKSDTTGWASSFPEQSIKSPSLIHFRAGKVGRNRFLFCGDASGDVLASRFMATTSQLIDRPTSSTTEV